MLEVGANGEDFVDEVFHGEDVVFTKCLFDDTVAGKRNALFVDLAVATVVDEFTNGLEVRLAVGKNQNLARILDRGFMRTRK